MFVGHGMGSVKTMCQHVVLMDQGRVVGQGTAESVADEYLKQVHERGNQRLSALGREGSEYPRWGTGEILTGTVSLHGSEGGAKHVFHPGEPFRVRVEEAHEATPEPVFGIGLYRSDGTYVNGSNHHWREQPLALGQVAAGESGAVEMSFEPAPPQSTTSRRSSTTTPSPRPAIDHREHAATFEVVDAQHAARPAAPAAQRFERGGERQESER